jgi:predicted component of type VI protein secretion system|tara:strand:- start:526 stop:636 length:111 start_codon:yes stop_codon:yes gene_type:complete
MGEEDFQRARKRVLDYGNDAIREIEENIEKFEIRLK